MEPKPYISLFRGRVNEPRQAVNENHNYCAIVLAHMSWEMHLEQRWVKGWDEACWWYTKGLLVIPQPLQGRPSIPSPSPDGGYPHPLNYTCFKLQMNASPTLKCQHSVCTDWRRTDLFSRQWLLGLTSPVLFITSCCQTLLFFMLLLFAF